MPVSQYIAEFVADATEQLSKVERMLLGYQEAGADADPELIDAVFRSVHSTKAGAGMLGLSQVEALAHEAEGVLQQLRNNPLAVDLTSVQAVLQAVSAIVALLIDVPQSKERNIEAALLELKRLQILVPGAVAKSEPLWGTLQCKVTSFIANAMENHVGNEVVSIRYVDGVERRVMKSEPEFRISKTSYDRIVFLSDQLQMNHDKLTEAIGSLSVDALSLGVTVGRLGKLLTELHEVTLNSRRQPISSIFHRFERAAREISAKLNKECRYCSEPNDVEIDQRVLCHISDALTHVLRNSLDHGIELPQVRSFLGKPSYGTILLQALPQAECICISISDDGAGIDPQKIRARAVTLGIISDCEAEALCDAESIELIFHSGFSTTKNPNLYSGRGVGMDVVKKNIELIGGSVAVRSQIGKGTTVLINVPQRIVNLPG